MKICSNPNCESSFLFGDNKTTCPFCHAPLIDNNGAAITQQLITPVDVVFDSEPEEDRPFISCSLGSVVLTLFTTELGEFPTFYQFTNIAAYDMI